MKLKRQNQYHGETFTSVVVALYPQKFFCQKNFCLQHYCFEWLVFALEPDSTSTRHYCLLRIQCPYIKGNVVLPLVTVVLNACIIDIEIKKCKRGTIEIYLIAQFILAFRFVLACYLLDDMTHD